MGMKKDGGGAAELGLTERTKIGGREAQLVDTHEKTGIPVKQKSEKAGKHTIK